MAYRSKATQGLPRHISEPLGAYYKSLGRFLESFAQMEALMQEALTRYVGLSDDIGKAVFSGVRIGAAKDAINRLLAVRKEADRKEQIKPYFDQLGTIGSVRDDIVHYGLTPSRDGALSIQNKRHAHIEKRLRVTPISAQILDLMTEDLHTIHAAMILTFPKRREDSGWLAEVNKIAVRPWFYKPGQPTPPAKAKGKKQPKRRPPPPSSPR